MSVWHSNYSISTLYFAIARWVISKIVSPASRLQASWAAGFLVCFLLPQFQSFLPSGLSGTLLPDRSKVAADAPVHTFFSSVSFTSLNMHKLGFAFHLNLQNEAHWFILQTHLGRTVMSCPPKKGRDGSADKIEKGGWLEVSLVC